MSYGKWWTGRFWAREWKCCGLRWQTLLSPRYPEREFWFPECPLCHEDGDWPLYEEYDKVYPPTRPPKVDLTTAPKCSPLHLSHQRGEYVAAKWKSQPKEVLEYWIKSLKEPTVFNTVLTDWEQYFVESLGFTLSLGGVLSQKQHEILEGLYADKTK